MRVTRRGVLALGGGIVAGGVEAQGALQAVDLRCEYLRDPRGIDAAMPRLSWRCAAADQDVPGLHQTAYRIRAVSGGTKIWDSGRVASDRTQQIVYAGTKLHSRQAVEWSVELWDQDGRRRIGDETGSWTMGLLDPTEWQGRWIGLDTPAPVETLAAEWFWSDEGRPMDRMPPGRRVFRRGFVLERPVAGGELAVFVAAADFARLAVDGVPVGDAFGWTDATAMRLPALASGRHVISAEVSNLGDVPKAAGLAVRLDPLFSGAAGWRGGAGPDAGWQKPDFDDTGWRPVVAWGPTGMAPWGPVNLRRPRPTPARWLRREFSLGAAPRAAQVSFCGLGWSDLHVNGTRVGDARLSPPLTDYDRRVTYVTYDVAGLLRAGDNALGVVLGPGRFVAPRPYARDFGWPKLRLHLDVTMVNGLSITVVSDAAWMLTLDGPIRDANEYDGEIVDARQAMAGWAEPGFDASSWRQAEVVAPPAGRLVAMRQPPTRVTERRSPAGVVRTGGDAWTFDFGQNLAGVCRLQTSAPPGSRITLEHAERLRRDGTLDTANLRSALAREIVILAGAEAETFTPRFTSHGFRYVTVTGLAAPPGSETLTALVISDDLRRTGHFDCSDHMLTRIHDAAMWSVRNNCRSIRTDCPQRDERQGWLGDPAIEARGEAYLFDNAAFYAKWLDDILDTQRADGALADVAPAYWQVYNDDISWPAALATLPGILHDQYGDSDVVAGAYPGLVRWLDRMWEKSGDTYGDWGAFGSSGAQPDPLIAAAYLQHCLVMAGDYAGRLGRGGEAASHAARADAQRMRFQERHYRPQDGLFGDGGATACILTLAFGLAAPEHVAGLRERLVSLILARGEPHPCFGLIGAQWVSRVLQQAGRGDLVHRMAVAQSRPGLGYMIAQGATTLWEFWDADTAEPSMSLDHTMLTGDLLAWLYQDLCGIRHDPMYRGFARAILAPRPVPTLDWARASYAAVTGTISSAWRREAGLIRYEFVLPPNVGATVMLPGEAPFESGPGQHVLTRKLS